MGPLASRGSESCKRPERRHTDGAVPAFVGACAIERPLKPLVPYECRRLSTDARSPRFWHPNTVHLCIPVDAQGKSVAVVDLTYLGPAETSVSGDRPSSDWVKHLGLTLRPTRQGRLLQKASARSMDLSFVNTLVGVYGTILSLPVSSHLAPFLTNPLSDIFQASHVMGIETSGH